LWRQPSPRAPFWCSLSTALAPPRRGRPRACTTARPRPHHGEAAPAHPLSSPPRLLYPSPGRGQLLLSGARSSSPVLLPPPLPCLRRGGGRQATAPNHRIELPGVVDDDTAVQARCGGGLRQWAAEVALPCSPTRAAADSCPPARVGALAGLVLPAAEVGLRRGGGYPCDVDDGSTAGVSLPPPTSLRPFRVLSVGAREVVVLAGLAPALEEAPVSLRIRRRWKGDGKMKGVIPSPLQGKKRYPSPPGEGYRHRCGWSYHSIGLDWFVILAGMATRRR
jgi:hypothetical protein